MESGHDPKSNGDGYTRLHITPLDLDLAKIVVPANGRNLSLHTIETFPEKRYGFVDLPSADADKLKRRLHGSTLKGVKMRIEQARPEQNQTEESTQKKGQKRSRISGTTTDDAALPSSKKHRSSSSSSKSEIGVIEGVALHDRKVKRGWTEPVATSKKKKSKHDATATTKKTARPRHKSKYTDQDECLLKTKLPPNAVGNLPTAERRRDKKRKRRDDGREVTVHEFEKTTKFPSFLKTVVPQTLGKPAVEFVEDKGWVDEDGELVEAVKPRAKGLKQKKGEARNKKQQQQQQQQQSPPPAAVQEESDDETSSSGESSDEETMPPPPSKAAAGQSLEEGGSDSSSDDDTTTTVQNQSPNPLRSGTHQSLLPLQRPLSSSDAKSPQQQQRPLSSSSSSRNSLTIKIPPPPATPSAASTTTTTNTKVHPLEALYKRSASQAAAGPSPAESQQQQQQQQQQFSFFDQQSDADDDAAGAAAPAVPMTPFTRADLEWRNVRSAAPTPDTAHPASRARSSYFWGSDDYDDDDGEEEEADSSSRTQIHVVAQPAQQQQEKDKGHKSEPAVSDFQSLFWDNRGDLNRSWMGRRKMAAKAKRHRANKARAYQAL